jgi:hypothetical protein
MRIAGTARETLASIALPAARLLVIRPPFRPL